MAAIQVKAVLRDSGTKGHARRLRANGRIPGILYGGGEESVAIALDSVSFEKMLRHTSAGNQILDLKVEGLKQEDLKVLIKEVQRSPIDSKVLHVDLQHVSMTHKVRVRVPVHLTGTAIGVKEGGVVEHFLREIDVECFPAEIPEGITLDVSHLDRGDSIHVSDLPLPNVHILDNPERVVVAVAGKAKEEEVAPAPAAEAAAATPAAEEKDKDKEKEAGKEKSKESAKGK